jgi:hypothetical protein
MAQNNLPGKKLIDKISETAGKGLKFLGRWFFMISILTAALFCVFVWYKFIWKADWSEEKKQSYINEQAKFSFDKAGYQRITEMINSRRDKFENFPRFTGRDIFFPD